MMKKFDNFDYVELEALVTALFYTPLNKVDERLVAVIEKLRRETNNELVDRDDRHWDNK